MVVTTLLFAALMGVEATDSEDWQGWRGPAGSGVASGSPPAELDVDSNLRWKVEVPGRGLCCPVIVGDRIYLTTAVAEAADAEEGGQAGEDRGEGGSEGREADRGDRGDRGGRGGDRGAGRGGFGGFGGFGRGAPPKPQKFMVLSLDRADGSVVWSKTVHDGTPHAGTHSDGTFATPTMVTDGEYLVASFGSDGIFVMKMDGTPVWDTDLGDMQIQGSFGEGSSPMLKEGVLVVNWDHEGESFIVGFDVETGDEMWRNERPSGTGWATPLIVEVEGEYQVIVAAARTVAYELHLGEELWSLGQAAAPPSEDRGGRGGFGGRGSRGGRGGHGGGRSGVIASPCVADGMCFVSNGSSMSAIDLASADGELEGEDAIAWTLTRDLPRIPSPIAYNGLVFVMKSNSGILSAVDMKTGELKYGAERLEGVANAYASPVAANGRLYFAGRDGMVEVVEAGAEFKSLGVYEFEDSFDASPAIVGDELFLRGRSHLYCFANKED